MVTTRKHPAEFPEPTSPSSPSPTGSVRSPALSPSPSTTVATRRSTSTTWAHTPSNLTLIWLGISLPLVIWDMGYIFGRPYTMPGGSLHSPFYTPYALYGKVDHVYGIKAWDNKEGFSAAQTAMNAVETAGYLVYLFYVYSYGVPAPGVKGRGAPKKAAKSELGFVQKLSQARVLVGKDGAAAALLLFACTVMTVSKTMLYWLREYYSGFADTGHNDLRTLITLWIIPNGAWLVVPSYLIYISAAEILQGLAIASGDKKRS